MPYPYYTNPYSSIYPLSYGGTSYPTIQNMPSMMQPVQQQPTYMINVDGENSAKSWQPVVIPQPNTIIPLFDSDGQHVYFKTYDAYGRMNPIRKGRIVFDDEIQVSETPSDSVQAPDLSGYATKDDLNKIKEEIEEILHSHSDQLGSTTKTNQNGSKTR